MGDDPTKRKLMRSAKVPLDAIQSEEDYCLYSPTKGPISSHMTAINAIKAFALVACGDPKTDARIYKREAVKRASATRVHDVLHRTRTLFPLHASHG